MCDPVPAFAHSATKLEVAECESSVKYPHEDHTSSNVESPLGNGEILPYYTRMDIFPLFVLLLLLSLLLFLYFCLLI